MSELYMKMNVKREYAPGIKDIRIEVVPKGRFEAEVTLKSELFRDEISHGTLLHVNP